MGPTSSGLDTLMALATNCPGNSVLLVARTCFVTTGAELAQPIARQETAPRSVAMALSVILFMTSLPSRSQRFELVFRVCERAGHGNRARPHSFDDYRSITSLHDHGHGRGGRISGRITSDRGYRVSPGREGASGDVARVRNELVFGRERSAVDEELHAHHVDIVRRSRRQRKRFRLDRAVHR